jgi:hypothetical protein
VPRPCRTRDDLDLEQLEIVGINWMHHDAFRVFDAREHGMNVPATPADWLDSKGETLA